MSLPPERPDGGSTSPSRGKLSNSEFFLEYEKSWQKAAVGWGEEAPFTRGWLTYSANYIFKSNVCNWAVDPLMPYALLEAPYPKEIPRPFHQLEVVLLTHRHRDHWDENLFQHLADQPRVWLAPRFLLNPLIQAGVNARHIVVLAPGETWEGRGLTATAYEGLHKEGGRGPDSFSWKVEISGQRFMFFGDVRNYDPTHYGKLDQADVAFAHVWLGRMEATSGTPALSEAFCLFHEHFKPRQIVLAHLEERSRERDDFWTRRHAAELQSRLSKTMNVKIPALLESLDFKLQE